MSDDRSTQRATPARPGTSAGTTADPSTVAAFFDVDNTLVRGASTFHLARALHAHGFFRARDIARFAVHQARYAVYGENTQHLDKVRSKALCLVAGHSVHEVCSIGEQVYDDVLALRIFPGTKALLEAHLAAGHQVWLVTAAPVEVGGLIARRLGATGALATVPEHDADGVYTGRLDGELMHGAAKARAARDLAARTGIDLDRSYAYGDSMNDVDLLGTVGHPCAVNAEPRLRRLARANGWDVREFRQPTRRAARTGVKAGGWVAAGWAATSLLRRAARR
ncbi:hydrolase [Luteimicrobium album]|uniref:Hydrolase n=1 Tax=Luteimicrobium album TaxID=1054550 RepID=A0ABQ6HYT6_9MICO|nr:HAD-IB family hydrolase [Luteimicrobium album]GMA22853.1 hydrolase [Luteimicrobium album]